MRRFKEEKEAILTHIKECEDSLVRAYRGIRDIYDRYGIFFDQESELFTFSHASLTEVEFFYCKTETDYNRYRPNREIHYPPIAFPVWVRFTWPEASNDVICECLYPEPRTKI